MVQELSKALRNSFSHVVTVRGGHVHQVRFRDEKLNDLDLALLLSRAKAKMPMLRAARKQRYLAALHKWGTYMRESNKNIVSGFVLLFEEMTKILERNEPSS